MRLIELIEVLLKEQNNRFQKIETDIKITNGNILLRSFRIYEMDWQSGVLKGLTYQEEYAHARENREPVYCFLNLNEIKEFSAPELGLEFTTEPIFVKA